MCRSGECVECRARAGQMMMDLPVPQTRVSAAEVFGEIDQVQLEAASILLRDVTRLASLDKMLRGPGGAGISQKSKELYQLALAIRANQFRFGRDGWEVVT